MKYLYAAAAAFIVGLLASAAANACELRMDHVYPRTLQDQLYPVTCVEKLVKPAGASNAAWQEHLRYVRHLNKVGLPQDTSPRYIRDAIPWSFDGGGGNGA